MEILMRFKRIFVLLTIVTTTTLACAGAPNHGFHGDFYNPAKYGGCYEDGVVFHVKKDRIILFGNGDQNDYIKDLRITNLSDQFVIEGVPSTNAEIMNRFKKIIIIYKSIDTGFMPVAMTIDDDVLDVKRASSRTMLENNYSLQRCDSPSFIGWLLMTIGWHTAFEEIGDQSS
jgi:hypothetical protein